MYAMTQKLAPLALALSVVLVAGLASPDAIAQKKKKSSKPKAPPAPTACTDFYSVATSDWAKAHPAPATGSVSAMGELAERSLQQQRELLDAAMQAPQGNVQ
jgi:putative endopeptidase